MSETETNSQGLPPKLPVKAKVDKKLKRVKQSSITIFVVSIIAILTFGQPILYQTFADNTSHKTLNLLASLTWAMAVYAIFFICLQRKRIIKLPKVSKYLGIIGTLILIANLVCSIVGIRPNNSFGVPGQLFSSTGPVIWNIDGRDYKIDKYYYLRVDGGDVQYTMDYEYAKAAEIKSKEEALKVALPIMKHACKYKKYGWVSSPSKKPQPAFIGVSLFTRVDEGIKGYRVVLPLDEVQSKN